MRILYRIFRLIFLSLFQLQKQITNRLLHKTELLIPTTTYIKEKQKTRLIFIICLKGCNCCTLIDILAYSSALLFRKSSNYQYYSIPYFPQINRYIRAWMGKKRKALDFIKYSPNVHNDMFFLSDPFQRLRLQNFSVPCWAMEFQEKMFLRFTDLQFINTDEALSFLVLITRWFKKHTKSLLYFLIQFLLLEQFPHLGRKLFKFSLHRENLMRKLYEIFKLL